NGGDLGLASDDEFYFGNAIGDSDGDGAVGDVDYDLLVSQFGQRGGIGTLSADLDADGRVGLRDFAIARTSFGNIVSAPTIPSPAPVAAPVSEPSPGLAASAGQETTVASSVNTAAVTSASVAIEEPILPAASAPTLTEPTVERELYDALQGSDSIDASQTALDTDDLLADILAEATLAKPL
ncbi:MAG: hypothetical protein QGH94_20830, partial [Phycisphaerae bacterium]|nr:hypothetical protein [Phycisphaerae bacterium]